METVRARLHPIWAGGRAGYLYSVIHDGKLLVERSRDPECDAARALAAKGITGKLILLDGKTGRSRSTVDIEKAATLTVREDNRSGPRLVKWRPMPGSTCEGSRHSPEEVAA